MIRFEWIRNDLTAVFLDNKRIGKIEKNDDGYRYYPHGFSSKYAGDAFKTLDACKQSLKDED